MFFNSSNNTNKLSPQEHTCPLLCTRMRSNNTNKLSPQELKLLFVFETHVQIIQINLVLKNLANEGASVAQFK